MQTLPTIITRENAPTEMEILTVRLSKYQPEENEIAKFKQVFVPEIIETGQEAGRIADHIKSLKSLKSRFDDIHKKEKSPFWECCKKIDAWKNDQCSKIDSLVNLASAPLLQYNRKIEQEERDRQLALAVKAKEEAERLAAEALAHESAGISDTAKELISMAIKEETKSSMIADSTLDVTARSRGINSVSSNRKPWTGIVESRAALDLELLRPYFSDDALDKAVKAAVRDGIREIRGAAIFQDEKLSVR